MDAIWLDTRHAFRRVTKHPGVAAAAVLTIGLAIGTATIVFSAVDALLLRPPAFRDPTSLVHTEYEVPGVSGMLVGVRQPEIIRWRQQPDLFAAFEAFFLGNAVLTGGDVPRAITVVHVTDGLLPMLGVEAAIGRTLGPGDAGSASQSPAVLLSNGIWQRTFDSDPDVVGRVVRLDDVVYVVAGVMPASFRFPFGTAQAWVVAPLIPPVRGQQATLFRSVARLAPGVTPDQAATRMRGLMTGASLGGPPGRVPHVFAVGSRQVGDRARQVLWMLLATVVLLVLISTANVVNLLITDGDAQARQQAVCAALGASTLRLLRVRILETVMLTGLGALLGLGLARAGVTFFVAQAPRELWVVQVNDIAVVWRVALAAAALAMACGVLAAVASATRVRLGDLGALRSGAGRHATVRGRWVVVGQVAAVTLLLTGSTLLARSYRNMVAVHPGFDVDRLVAFDVNGPGNSRTATEAAVQLFARIDAAVRAVPGVVAVASSPDGAPPTTSYDYDLAIEIEGRGLVVSGDESLVLTIESVAPGYFATLGVPIRQGRGVDAGDHAGAPAVAVISETFARRYWPAGAAVGSRFRTKRNGDVEEWEEWRTVVGVAGDVFSFDPLIDRAPLAVYRAAGQQSSSRNFRTFVVRSVLGDPAALVPSLVAALEGVDPALPVPEFTTMRARYTRFLAAPRFYALVTAWISGLGLVLAIVGIVGLSLVATARRTAEFGVRLALGAVPRHIVRLVLAQAAVLVGGGIVIGLVAVQLAAQVLRGLVAGVSPTDAPSALGSATALAVLALLGCAWPARRALRVTPAEALRVD